jgi:hypothetical protein
VSNVRISNARETCYWIASGLDFIIKKAASPATAAPSIGLLLDRKCATSIHVLSEVHTHRRALLDRKCAIRVKPKLNPRVVQMPYSTQSEHRTILAPFATPEKDNSRLLRGGAPEERGGRAPYPWLHSVQCTLPYVLCGSETAQRQ